MSSILIFNWKDIAHPDSGGAEVVTWELAKRLIKDGHKVTFVTSQYPDSSMYDVIDDIEIVRIGTNKFLHTFQANKYYSSHFKDQFDTIIEVVNTAPYFIKYTKGKEKLHLFYHQLARKIWFYETGFPLNLLGYLLLEPVATLAQSFGNTSVITVSNSTKSDLRRFNFNASNIHIIREGITNTPLISYDSKIKDEKFTILFHSSLRAMKRPLDALKAFNLAHSIFPNMHMKISGGGDQRLLQKFIKENYLTNKVELLGRTDESTKIQLLKQCSVLISTSIKEGWGLIISEAHSMATPTITYDVDGLRDASKHGSCPVTKHNNPYELSKLIISYYKLFRYNPNKYNDICSHVLLRSKELNFENSYTDFKQILKL
jgi:glycosyltransferase involved in cell wall biosynthesis